MEGKVLPFKAKNTGNVLQFVKPVRPGEELALSDMPSAEMKARILRIKESLMKIDALMRKLREVAAQEQLDTTK